MEPSKKLFENLKKAVEKLNTLGKHSDMMSHYDSAEELALFIKSKADSLEDGSLAAKDFQELLTIFTPTSEWDDYTRDAALGEAIYEELKQLKR